MRAASYRVNVVPLRKWRNVRQIVQGLLERNPITESLIRGRYRYTVYTEHRGRREIDGSHRSNRKEMSRCGLLIPGGKEGTSEKMGWDGTGRDMPACGKTRRARAKRNVSRETKQTRAVRGREYMRIPREKSVFFP